MINRIQSFFTRTSVFLAQAVAIAFIVIALLTLITTLWQVYGNRPPIRLYSLDPDNLGSLCPGESRPIRNRIEIQSVAFISYHSTVMDKNQVKNIANTQTTTKDYIHPTQATFDQEIAWEVPDLDPGEYTRVFAAIGTNGNNKPEIVVSFFTVPPDCLHSIN